MCWSHRLAYHRALHFADTLSHRILRFRAGRADGELVAGGCAGDGLVEPSGFFFQSEYECHMQPELGFGVEEI